MVPSGLLEAMAALGLQAVVLASMLAGSTAIAVLVSDAWTIHAELFAERQIEQLVDTAVTRAGTGPASPPAIAAATPDVVVFHADLDGDGAVDTTSSEQTELELRHPSVSSSTLMHHLGRQGMTVEEHLPPAARLVLIGPHGTASAAADASGIKVPRRGSSLVAAVPARLP